MWFKNGLKAQKLLAQGIALGIGASALSGRMGFIQVMKGQSH